MPTTGFSIGREVALDLIHPTLGPVTFGLLTSFNSRPIKQRLQSIPITNNGQTVYRLLYHGWEGEFIIDRTDDTVDTLFTLLQDNYIAGNQETYFMLTETIKNPDQSIVEYRYTNVIIEPEDAGMWRGEEKVTQRFAFVATKRERV